jgi:predicted N-acyltransferase
MTALSVEFHNTIDQIGQETWDSCAAPEAADGSRPFDPFTTYRFLHALEISHSVGQDTGWLPYYMQIRADDTVIGVAPLYLKLHSQGEYIFDHSWAHALERAGGQYYPKFQIAVPFTPATGRRILARAGYEEACMNAAQQGVHNISQKIGASSLHITFCTQDEHSLGASHGLLPRVTQQFHWENQGYSTFDDFLAALASRKRKNIRKERAAAHDSGLRFETVTGEDITPRHWDAMWRFYQDTGARKWGTPYLTRAFFDVAHDVLRDDIVMMFAYAGEVPIAGAMNFIGRETLFGRYWGCTAHVPYLHFELCYYQAMDFAIAHGLNRVEAGAQGEHKLARGYLPTPVYSLHWMREPRFHEAVGDYLEHERAAMDQEMEFLSSFGPFKSVSIEEQD